MLSYIYRLVRSFENEHGIPPNLLYLNQAHFSALSQEMKASVELDDLAGLLGMELIISQEAIHPHVAWRQPSWHRQAV